MKAFVGLGNPEDKYQNNRHNVGFMAITFLAKKSNLSVFWQLKPSLQSAVIKTGNILYVKPQIFMNSSGEAIKKVTDFYKISLDDLYVFYDDLDIRLGEYKIQKGKGPHDHKGILSIRNKLGSLDFWHIRIGVDSRDPDSRIPGQEYVLQNFADEEKTKLQEIFLGLYQDLHGQK